MIAQDEQLLGCTQDEIVSHLPHRLSQGVLRWADETVVAFVQPETGVALDVAALLAYARERLAGYKVPSRVVVMEQLPAAPSGKILKARLPLY